MSKEKIEWEDFRNVHIESLNLSQRVCTALAKIGINTFGDLFNLSKGELRSIRNLGVKGIEEIETKIEEILQNPNFEDKKEERKYSIKILDFSKGTYWLLTREGIHTIYDLFHLDENKLDRIINIVGRNKKEIYLEKKRILQDPSYDKQKIFDECKRRKAEEEKAKKENPGITEIGELGFSVRVYNGLIRCGIKTVDDLLALNELDMLNLRNIGKQGLDEIKRKKEELYKNPKFKEKEETEKKSIQNLNLSIGICEALIRNGIETIDELFALSSDELLSIRGISERKAREIQAIKEAVWDEEKLKEQKEAENNLISSLIFSARTYNALRRAGIYTIDDLLSFKKIELENIRGLGNKSMQEVIAKKKEILQNSTEDGQEKTKSHSTNIEELRKKSDSLKEVIEEDTGKLKRAEKLLTAYEKLAEEKEEDKTPGFYE